MDKMPPIHPGEILRDELEARGLSARKFAILLGIPANAVTQITNGQRAISARTAILLSREIGTTPEYWMNLQTRYDLKLATAALSAKSA
jgi:addiction module HigA family antidote